MLRYYSLDHNNKPIPNANAFEWAQENPYRKIVGSTLFPNGARVSTVFLCMDHGWDDGPPVLWETMVFGTPEGSAFEDSWQDRYTSHERAVAGHIAVVAALIAEFDISPVVPKSEVFG